MENYEHLPYPTLYDDNIILGEYCGEQLQNCCFRSILELVGLFDLHKICQIDSVASRKAASAAIEKFNRQHHTNLTYECVRDLTPTYAFSPVGDPIIYSNNMYELKKRMCHLILDNPVMSYEEVDFNEVNAIMRTLNLSGIDFVCVYYSGFWVVYQSPFINQRIVVDDGPFCMSEDMPVPGINLSNQWNHSYSFPPEEEASLKMSHRITPTNFYHYERRAQ